MYLPLVDVLGFFVAAGVVVATGRRDYPNQNIYTYRLHGYTFHLNLN